MKTAIIISDGIKQIVFTPENDAEKDALKMFNPSDDISLAVADSGIFSPSQGHKPFTVDMNECKGGYLRAFNSDSGRVFVLRKKEDIPKGISISDQFKLIKAYEDMLLNTGSTTCNSEDRDIEDFITMFNKQ